MIQFSLFVWWLQVDLVQPGATRCAVLHLRKFSGSWKDSWIVNYFLFSWRLLVDRRIKPGFDIVLSIWQPFQKRFFLKISILNIFSDLQNIFGLSLFGFRAKRCKSNDWRVHTRVVLYPDLPRPSGCTTFQLHGRIWGRDYYEEIPTPPQSLVKDQFSPFDAEFDHSPLMFFVLSKSASISVLSREFLVRTFPIFY